MTCSPAIRVKSMLCLQFRLTVCFVLWSFSKLYIQYYNIYLLVNVYLSCQPESRSEKKLCGCG